MVLPFLDTNIFICHLRQDDIALSKKASAIFSHIEKGELTVVTSDLVIFETVFTLRRFYKESKEDITKALLPLIELSGIRLVGKKRYRKIFAMYVSTSLGFVDCYHVVFMKQRKLRNLISFDKGFDRISGIKRIEPQ